MPFNKEIKPNRILSPIPPPPDPTEWTRYPYVLVDNNFVLVRFVT